MAQREERGVRGAPLTSFASSLPPSPASPLRGNLYPAGPSLYMCPRVDTPPDTSPYPPHLSCLKHTYGPVFHILCFTLLRAPPLKHTFASRTQISCFSPEIVTFFYYLCKADIGRQLHIKRKCFRLPCWKSGQFSKLEWVRSLTLRLSQ